MMELIQIEPARKASAPKPEWLKARAPGGENYHDLKRLARSLDLHTVCESAHCPNIGECWQHKTATFMMLGNLCTRRCGFFCSAGTPVITPASSTISPIFCLLSPLTSRLLLISPAPDRPAHTAALEYPR